MTQTHRIAELAGRILIATIFLASGLGKIANYAATQGYMSSAGVPGALLPLVILTEAGGALLIIAGLWTRFAATSLAGFAVLTAIFFHANFQDQMQQINFMKNLAIAGGFLLLAVHGAGAWSLDARRARA
jgi:putative oxidoreductase